MPPWSVSIKLTWKFAIQWLCWEPFSQYHCRVCTTWKLNSEAQEPKLILRSEKLNPAKKVLKGREIVRNITDIWSTKTLKHSLVSRTTTVITIYQSNWRTKFIDVPTSHFRGFDTFTHFVYLFIFNKNATKITIKSNFMVLTNANNPHELKPLLSVWCHKDFIIACIYIVVLKVVSFELF